MSTEIDPNVIRERLAAPFYASQVEWRLQSSGYSNNKFWGLCVAYITNRAVMDRLEEVCGIDGWRNRFEPIILGNLLGMKCTLSIRFGDVWIDKEDMAECTDIEAIKGAASDAMKRAAVQWGIGRYLYGLKIGRATIDDQGKYRGEVKKGDAPNGGKFRWNPPQLPPWALPQAENGRREESQEEEGIDEMRRTAATMILATQDEATLKRHEASIKKSTRYDDQAKQYLLALVNSQRNAIGNGRKAISR